MVIQRSAVNGKPSTESLCTGLGGDQELLDVGGVVAGGWDQWQGTRFLQGMDQKKDH